VALCVATAALWHAQGQAPARIALINMQKAILSTKDGQKAQMDLQTRFLSRKQQLEKKQTEIQSLRDQLQRGSATMSDEAKSKLMRDIDANTKSLQREGEDYDTDVQQDEGKIMNEVGSKIMDVVIKYATTHGCALVIDVGVQQTPVLWSAPNTEITDEIVKLYDQAHPPVAAAKPAPPAPAPKK
jgi:outer membrane protein